MPTLLLSPIASKLHTLNFSQAILHTTNFTLLAMPVRHVSSAKFIQP
jgi:hypothetical protein